MRLGIVGAVWLTRVRHTKRCPACRCPWREWPATSYALSELVRLHFPRRWARGERDRAEAVAQLRAQELQARLLLPVSVLLVLIRQRIADAQANRGSILFTEGKLFLAALLLGLLLWYQGQRAFVTV